MVKISAFEIHGNFQSSLAGIFKLTSHWHFTIDVRFPTSLTGDGTDAMYIRHLYTYVLRLTLTMEMYRNTECDYSSAYVTLLTDSDLVGHGMTFTIGRGNDIVQFFILLISQR
jgi:L-fuconate dehydratase